jgi:hypothetical protein
VTEWFDLGGSLQLGDALSANDVITHAKQCRGWSTWRTPPGVARNARRRCLASGIDFVL